MYKQSDVLKRIELFKQAFSAQGMISDHLLNDYPGSELKLDAYMVEMSRGLLMTLSAYIAAQAVDKREVTYPKTWWDAFKLRFFSAFLLKKFPPKMETVTWEAKLIYPDLRIPEQRSQMLIFDSRDN